LIQISNENSETGWFKTPDNERSRFFAQILTMHRKAKRKTEISDTALHEQFRLGLVYDTSYLNEILNIHRFFPLWFLGVSQRPGSVKRLLVVCRIKRGD